MRWLTRVVIAFALLAGPAASAAQAVTLKDLIDLKKVGISDAVLVALIDSDGTVFQLTATEVRTLRDAGFSDSLIISILNTSAKSRAKVEAVVQAQQEMWAEQAQPQYWTVQQQPAPSEVVSSVPTYGEPTIPFGIVTTVPLPSSAYGPHRQSPVRPGPLQTPVYVAVPTARPARDQPPAPKAPEYWGFGGQLRPDAWKDPGTIKR